MTKSFVIEIHDNGFIRILAVDRQFTIHPDGDEAVAYYRAADANSVMAGWLDYLGGKDLLFKFWRWLEAEAKINTCEATVVRHCEDSGELCGKKCEPGSYLCAEHEAEAQ